MKNILTTLFDIDVDRRSIGGDKAVRYHGIELSDICGELEKIDTE